MYYSCLTLFRAIEISFVLTDLIEAPKGSQLDIALCLTDVFFEDFVNKSFAIRNLIFPMKVTDSWEMPDNFYQNNVKLLFIHVFVILLFTSESLHSGDWALIFLP